MTLTEFLLARIAEDEAVALAAQGEPDAVSSYLLGFLQGSHLSPGDRLVAHPARVRAECEAKRRIVGLHDAGWSRIVPNTRLCPSCAAQKGVATKFGCLTLRTLVSVYADHPDWREEWRL